MKDTVRTWKEQNFIKERAPRNGHFSLDDKPFLFHVAKMPRDFGAMKFYL